MRGVGEIELIGDFGDRKFRSEKPSAHVMDAMFLIVSSRTESGVLPEKRVKASQ